MVRYFIYNQKKFKEFSLPQLYAVMEIHQRKNILISAPTGATKTLTGFLAILNELVDSAQKQILEDQVYAIYISPLKALNYDINYNLLKPLSEMEELAGKKLVKELGRAVERGVDVKIILSDKTDLPIVDATSKTYFKKLLQRGVRIYLFGKGGERWVHAKTMTVDGKYGTIGSSNLDYVSLSLDYEINFFFGNVKLALELEQKFKQDLTSCQEIDLRSHKQRQKQRPILEKIQSLMGYKLLGSLLTPESEKYK